MARIAGPSCQTLQWGRGVLPAEGDALAAAVAGLLHASMGPRVFTRGGASRRVVLFLAETRLQWGRGFLPAEGTGAGGRSGSTLRLQWGRGFLPAEGIGATRIEVEGDMLQWGRGFLPAEGARLSSR